MNITDKDIDEFQQLYHEKFGIELNRIEARQKLTLFVRQMEIVYQPATQA